MFTKTALSIPNPLKSIPSGVWKADIAGLGPISTAVNAIDVGTGNASVGEALAGTTTGGLAYLGADKLMRKPAAKVTSLASRVLPSFPNPATRGARFLSKLPGWTGAAARIGTALGVSGVIGNKARKLGREHMPIWKRETLAKPLQSLTPEQHAALNKYTFRS